MATMKALRYYGKEDIRLDQVPIPAVQAHQVRVEPAYTGICGTDLHEYIGGANLIPTTPHAITGEAAPLILGHEFTGIVREAGSQISNFKVGDRVVIEPIIYDGTCRACTKGYLNCCASNGFIGLSGIGGGFAESIVLEEKYLHHLPDSIPLKTGGSLDTF